MSFLSRRTCRSNIIQIWQFLLFVSTVQLLYGCGVLSNMGTFLAAVKDPQSMVGKYFEVGPNVMFVGTGDVERYESAMSGIKKDPMAGMREFMDLFKQEVFVNLNKPLNSEQVDAKLIFQIIDFKEYETARDLFFKVKIYNKKYRDTTWWISFSDLGKTKPTSAPYAQSPSDPHKVSSKHFDKSNK